MFSLMSKVSVKFTMCHYVLFLSLLLSEVLTFQYDEEPFSYSNDFVFQMSHLLGLSERKGRLKVLPSLRNSASQFLLQVYNEITQEEDMEIANKLRHKRVPENNNFITPFDRKEIARCNNIITFSNRPSKKIQQLLSTNRIIATSMLLNFNTNDVPRDLELVHSVLRIYQQLPMLDVCEVATASEPNITISLYHKIRRKHSVNKVHYQLITAINTTTSYEGWLEFNVTHILAKWIYYRTLEQIINGNELLVAATLSDGTKTPITIREMGLIGADTQQQLPDLQPFIIGYFKGPELLAKIQKLRSQRDLISRKHRTDYNRQSLPTLLEVYQFPKSCERLNFTLDFKDLQMHNWVIAPKKFEAFFCSGECNFPLASRMNPSNHAIVQTLMHLKQPHLPKACCVPTKLGGISILHYLNEDSVNLSKYPHSVAKECGCL